MCLLRLPAYIKKKSGCAPQKICVNCISPGGLFTNQPDHFYYGIRIKFLLVGRMADRDDIKGVIVFLASDASAYINGGNHSQFCWD